MLKWSRLGAVVALSAGLLALGSPAAIAQDPVDLGGAYTLDTVGAISGDEQRVIDALDSLYERARIQLVVVYVDTFTNPSDPVNWADLTAERNGFGTDDVLLAVAVEDRQYALSIDPGFTLSDAQLDDVEGTIEDALRDDRWADAAIDGARAMEAAATGVVGPNVPDSTQDPATPATPDSSGGVPILPIVGGVAVVGVGIFIYSRLRRRKDESVAAAPEQMTQKQLDQRAGSLLVQLDDSLKTSEQELGFAVAQFGDAATADFTATLASAKAKVAEAFTLKQKLDDAQADSDADKRAWTSEIIRLTEAADAELDAQADAFDELRQLEKNAPQALTEVRAAASAAGELAASAAASLAALTGRYSAAALKPVAENVDQAAKLLSFAAAAADKAKAAIDAGNASEAAIAVRTAQASVGQAAQLFDAIETLSTNLGEASEKLDAAVEDTKQDIAAARALPQDAASASLAPAIAAAQQALEDSSATKGDPLASLALLEKANAALDDLFSDARDTQEKIARARAQLDPTMSAARAQITSAMEYITTRRGGIGSTARTRVSEADRHLAQATALAASDPVAALAQAQQAASLAAGALDYARQDVASFDAREGFSQQERSQYNGVDGADLGGILGDWLFGGGGSSSSSSGGWFSGGSGSSSRSSWSGGGSRRSGSSRSGSFGGSSRSSARSSGGGRSRGGRF
ncbi:MAG: hypothetical protein JWP85_1017 [Rhodoglobus sp.]|nr:hypothetical protein [Rhodoglobus sp.]